MQLILHVLYFCFKIQNLTTALCWRVEPLSQRSLVKLTNSSNYCSSPYFCSQNIAGN